MKIVLRTDEMTLHPTRVCFVAMPEADNYPGAAAISRLFGIGLDELVLELDGQYLPVLMSAAIPPGQMVVADKAILGDPLPGVAQIVKEANARAN